MGKWKALRGKRDPGMDFSKVPRRLRMKFLIQCLYKHNFISKEVIKIRRDEFQIMRDILCPLAGKTCYACPRPATDRHHVIPLCKGGSNVPENLVPLCSVCHRKTFVLHKHPEFKRMYQWSPQPRPMVMNLPKVCRTGSLSSNMSVVSASAPLPTITLVKKEPKETANILPWGGIFNPPVPETYPIRMVR